MSMTTTYTGVRIVDMPDLGAVTDNSSVVGEHAGSGRFGALALRSYINANSNNADVREYGAKGDGATNDTAAFNAAAAALAAKGGGVVWVPIGQYLTDPIVLPPYVSMSGAIPGPFDPQTAIQTHVPTLLVNSTATPFLTLGVDGFCSDLLIYYPQQVAPSASAPHVYPECINIPSTCRVSRMTLINPYVGIKVMSGRSVVEDCRIGSYQIGVLVDPALDVVWIARTMIGPYHDSYVGLPPGQPIDTWLMANGAGFVFGHADAFFLTDCFVSCRAQGVQFADSTSTYTGGAYGMISNMDMDAVNVGVAAKSVNRTGGGIKISNMNCGIAADAVATTPGQAALELLTGGSQAPLVSWNGGGARCAGGLPAAPNFISVGAGTAFVSNVIGINPVGPISPGGVPASDVAFTNPYPFRCRVYINGTFTVRPQFVDTGIANPQLIIMDPGEVILIHYTGAAPTWVWFGE